jgi:hypothetical protein
LWILCSAFLGLCGWTLAATHHLDIVGYTVAFLVGAVLFLFWAVREVSDFRLWRERRGSDAYHAHLLVAKRRRKRLLPLAFSVLLALVCLGAAIHSPNNYDALTYRVPQILHWLSEHRWHWILASDNLLNINSPGYGWLMAPAIVFLKTDRLFALPNIIAFTLLPGLFFSAARRCGVGGRVAWMWMWIVPAMSCLAMQAGSMGNDLLPGVYALAALAFGLRARQTNRWEDFCISALAAGLITGIKITAAPLALPWFVATFPCWRSVRNHWLSTALTILVALAISYLPTAILNSRYAGSWNGDPENRYKIQISSPLHGVVGNSLMILTGALEPSVCPAVGVAKSKFTAFKETGVSNWITAKFPRFGLSWGELATEEGAGIGLAVFLLVVLSIAASVWRGHFAALLTSNPWVFGAILLAFGAFLAKMGSEAAARLATPYYPFLFIVVLANDGQEWLTRRKWWRALAIAVVISILPAVILSPARPLWPAQQFLRWMAQRAPDSKAIQRARVVYDVYAKRDDYLAPLKARLPEGARMVGAIPTANDLEGTLWKPYGSRKIVEVLTPSPDDPALAMLRGSAIITSPRAIGERFGLTPESYAAAIRGRIAARELIAQKAGVGPEEWVLISLDGSSSDKSQRMPSAENK